MIGSKNETSSEHNLVPLNRQEESSDTLQEIQSALFESNKNSFGDIERTLSYSLKKKLSFDF